MEILLIILFAPVALVAGFGLLRLFAQREFWIVVLIILGILGLSFNLLTAPYRRADGYSFVSPQPLHEQPQRRVA